jgi:hypothetical protein
MGSSERSNENKNDAAKQEANPEFAEGKAKRS